MAEGAGQWRDAVGAEQLWASLCTAAAAARKAGDDRRGGALRAFWLDLREALGTAPIVRSLAGEWISPPHARLAPAGMPALAEGVLSELGVNLVDRTIAADVSALRTEIPVRTLDFEETLAALEQVVPIDQVCAPQELAAPFDDSEVREALLGTLALLVRQPPAATAERVQALTLAPEITGKVGPLQSLYSCSKPDYELFRRVDPALLFLDGERMQKIDAELAALAPEWDLEAAANRVAEPAGPSPLHCPERSLTT